MVRYVLGRLGQALLVVFVAWSLAFFLLFALPSDPVSLLLGPDASDVSPEQRAALAAQYGFDQPILVQYWNHLTALFTGDLGFSAQLSAPVSQVLGSAIGPTLQVAGLGFVFAVVFGAGTALAAAYLRSPWLRNILLSLPSLGVSIPAFWFGLMLIQIFSFRLQLLPAFSAEGFASLILPAVTLALPTGAMIAQVFARSLLTALHEPYAATAAAKGVTRLRVEFAHAARNAALPVLTIAGLVVGQLFSGTVVTETVFSRPGLGRVIATAVTGQDFPVVLGAVLIGAVLYTSTSLIVDLIYPIVDPRLRGKLLGRSGARGAASGPSRQTPAGATA